MSGDYDDLRPEPVARPEPKPERRLVVEIRETVTVETKVDIVTYFANLSENSRRHYMALDPDDDEFVGEGEYYWPMAWLIGDQGTVEADTTLHGKGVKPAWTDYDNTDLYIHRPVGVPGRLGSWGEADFDYLRSQVEWLAAFHDRRERGVSETSCAECGEQVERLPGGDYRHVERYTADHEARPAVEPRLSAGALGVADVRMF